MIQVSNLSKSFTLHNQGGVQLQVLSDVSFDVEAGQCMVLNGPSGTGKSTLLRSLYANYLPQQGQVRVRHQGELVDLWTAPAHTVLEIRRQTIGYVSQFLRVIPRVSTLDIVSEPLRRDGVAADEARARARQMLARLNVPESLWSLAPSTFSGGEQQRVNIAHCFVKPYPVLLLDEPTASLDARNRQVVLDLMAEALQRGAALVGIFHDAEVQRVAATHYFDLHTQLTRSAA